MMQFGMHFTLLTLVLLAIARSTVSSEHVQANPSGEYFIQGDNWWTGGLWSELPDEEQQKNEYQVELLSSAGPQAYLLRNFLTHTEADHLINLVQGRFKQSTVVGAFGISTADTGRTSSGASLRRGHDAVVAAIEDRLAAFTKAPVNHGEALHVLRYELGEEYEPHHDFFHDERSVMNGGQRVGTVIMYLSDDYTGGETVFPKSVQQGSYVHGQGGLSDCAKQGLAVKPSKGDALFFLSVQADGNSMDELSLHTSCPVISGSKYVATKWLRSDVVHGY